MGGVAKGLLQHQGETLVARWLRLCAECEVPAVLVGEHPAYAELAAVVPDLGAVGPLGGLVALLRQASTRYVVSVACDMPYVSRELLTRLLDAPHADVTAARRQHWEPFFARHAVAATLPLATQLLASERHALRPLFERAVPLALTADEARQLRDWDYVTDLDAG